MIVLPIAYFPPIPWFSALLDEEEILLEVCQHYRKQQISNRMFIKAANGILGLSIPVKRRGRKMPIKDKKISYQEDWTKQHWQSLISAYRNSPFFMYYENELAELYKKKPEYLLDFLEDSLSFIWEKLGLGIKIAQTESYQDSEIYGEKDFRTAFGPKPHDAPLWFQEISYPQVFEGFHAGLSILDLLFNEGPNGMHIIKSGKKANPQSHP